MRTKVCSDFQRFSDQSTKQRTAFRKNVNFMNNPIEALLYISNGKDLRSKCRNNDLQM